MLFMVKWELYPDKKMDAFAAFGQMTAEEDAADLGPDITLIGRWHDFASGGGAAIIECDSAEHSHIRNLAWLAVAIYPVGSHSGKW